jgi:hypothetical protein
VRKGLDALPTAWFKADGSVEEAAEVMTAAVKGLRRKYADRRPWAHAFYMEGDYFIGLGRCPRGPQLQFSRCTTSASVGPSRSRKKFPVRICEVGRLCTGASNRKEKPRAPTEGRTRGYKRNCLSVL